MSSILDLSSCAYAKGVLLEVFSSNVGLVRVVGEPHPKFIARVNTQRFSIYNSIFMNCDKFDVAYKTFVAKFPQIKERFTLWGKRYSGDKRTFLKNYNAIEWDKKINEEKIKHALFNCEICMEDTKLKEMCKGYPLKKLSEKKRAEDLGWRKSKGDPDKEKKVEKSEEIKLKENEEKKPSTKQVKAIKRKMKIEIEAVKMKSCVERTFGNHISLKQRQKMRLQESFESVPDCKVRSQMDTEQKQKKHIGNSMKWDLNECIREVSQLADGSYVNFSQLARKYHVCNANGDILKMVGKL